VAIPKFKVQKRRSVPWWTQEIDQKRKEVNRLRRMYQRSDDKLREKNKRIYYSAKKAYQRLVDQSKRNSWQKYCGESRVWSMPWKISQHKLKVQTPIASIKKNDGTYTETIASTMSYMIDELFPLDDPLLDTQCQKVIRDKMEIPIQTPDDCEITELEISDAITGQNDHKAPGIDGLSAEIIKRSYIAIPQVFMYLFNKCFEIGYFPRNWKIANLKLILKAKDRLQELITSYRPISLLPIIGKSFERIITNRLQWYLYTNNLMHGNQYGFTPQKSAEDLVNKICETAKNQLKNKGITLMVSLDIRGAFDNAWHPMIMENLRSKNCPKNVFEIVKSYLNDRKLIFKIGDHSVERLMNKGCPQGSVIGPLLWNILYDGLLRIKMPIGSEIFGFADDTLLLITGNTMDQIRTRANRALKMINDWGKEVKLQFNNDKSAALIITKKQKCKLITLKLGSGQIPIVKSLKYLGVTIDSTLNWTQHINTVLNRAIKTIHRLGIIARNTWGLGSEALKIIYKGAIEPIVLYCSSVWVEAVKRKRIVKSLLRVQRLIAIRIVKAFRTVSTEAAIILAGIIPLNLRVEETADLFKIKKVDEYTINGINNSDLQRPLNFQNRFHPSKEPIIMTNENNGNLNIYTDGSKLNGHVGCAFTIWDGNQELTFERKRLDNRCSVFQAELLAIKGSLKAILNMFHSNEDLKRIIINSDSISSINAIVQIKSRNQMVHDIKTIINELKNRNIQISFNWVKAHSGERGNERSDQLAKEAASSQRLIEYKLINESAIKSIIRQRSLRKWNEQWKETHNGALTKMYFPTIEDRMKINNQNIFNYKFTQFLTGHGNFRQYLKRIGVESSAECECGKGEETPIHLIFDCDKLLVQRQQMVNESIRRKKGWPIKLYEIINDKSMLLELIMFINCINI
jgi:ribonuclease HI